MIQNLGGLNSWIGGKKDGSDWTWSDDTAWDYNHFEGSSANIGECAVMRKDKWVSIPCGVPRKYVCYKDGK